MAKESSNIAFCHYCIFVVLLLTPILSVVEARHHHNNRVVFGASDGKNYTGSAIDALLPKLNESMLPNDSSSLRASFNFTKDVISDNLSDATIRTSPENTLSSVELQTPTNPKIEMSPNYTAYNESCYKCLYEQQLENAIYKILNNTDNITLTKPNDSCSQCLLMEEYSNKTQSVGCMCALYTTSSPTTADLPLRTKTFQNVTCHELVPFEEACKKVCILGTLSYNELEPATLCYHMNTVKNVKAYVESKICKENTEWVFTGLASTEPVCCDKGAPVNCTT